MSNLSKYYFQDIPAEVMDEIMTEMCASEPQADWEEVDYWLNCHNVASTVPGWYESAEQFLSDRQIGR